MVGASAIFSIAAQNMASRNPQQKPPLPLAVVRHVPTLRGLTRKWWASASGWFRFLFKLRRDGPATGRTAWPYMARHRIRHPRRLGSGVEFVPVPQREET